MWYRNARLVASSRKVEPCPRLLRKVRMPSLETDKQLYLYHSRGPYLVQTVLRIYWGRHKLFPLICADLMLRFGSVRNRTTVESA